MDNESKKSPFILFMKDIEKFLLENVGALPPIKSMINRIPENVIVIGPHMNKVIKFTPNLEMLSWLIHTQFNL